MTIRVILRLTTRLYHYQQLSPSLNALSFAIRRMSTHISYSSTVSDSANCIDMRSDTVTLPSPSMIKAMAEAKLGDDVYGEDPTINSLERRCAELFGKEAGLFVTSGTMGNLLAVLAHCQRGDEIIVGRDNHIHRWEQGNYAQLAGVSATTLNTSNDGTMKLSEIKESIRVFDSHMPVTKLICVENTHNYAGGKVLPMEYLKAVRDIADDHNIKVHMDGARIYNAAAVLGLDIREIASYVDSVMMCFSKGLGAPVGSILVGSTDFIELARRKRKAVGGGWRQAGILAAAAHIALDNALETVQKDNQNAIELARGINHNTPQHLHKVIYATECKSMSNMVLLNCASPVTVSQVVQFFQSHKILVMGFDSTRIRMVLNWGVDESSVQKVIQVYKLFIESLQM